MSLDNHEMHFCSNGSIELETRRCALVSMDGVGDVIARKPSTAAAYATRITT
jgi:hypothetical protein